jgi:hypothetical protein
MLNPNQKNNLMVSLGWRPIFPLLTGKRIESGASSGLKPGKTIKK